MPQPTAANLIEYTKRTGKLYPTVKNEEHYFKVTGQRVPWYKEKKETAVQRLARVKAERALAKKPETVQTVGGKPITKITKETKERVAYRKAKAEEKKQLTPKKGRTIEKAAASFGKRAGELSGLEKTAAAVASKRIQEQIESEGLTDPEKIEKRRKELNSKIDPVREILKTTRASLADSSQMLVNIQRRPEIFGKDPDVDVIFRNTQNFEQALDEFKQTTEGLTAQIVNELGQKGQLGPAGEYYDKLARQKAQEEASKAIAAKYGYSLEDMERYLALVKEGIDAP